MSTISHHLDPDAPPTAGRRSAGLSRRRIIAGALAVGASALAARPVLAVEGPEEIGLPEPGTEGPPEEIGLPESSGRRAPGDSRSATGAGSDGVTDGDRLTGDRSVSTAMEPVTINGRTYTAYTETFVKQGQWTLYSCEFDVAHMIMMTFGVETALDDLLGYVGLDNPFQPYAEQTPSGLVIYGGDIGEAFCGDLTSNTFAKTRGSAIRRAFEGFDFRVETVSSRSGVKRGLAAGKLMWLKTTVDFTDYLPTRWLTPDGTAYPTVYDNDHCVAAIGYDDDIVVIRDALGPTNTNWDRRYEYEVPWDVFMDCWSSGGYDGLLISPLA